MLLAFSLFLFKKALKENCSSSPVLFSIIVLKYLRFMLL